MKELKIQKNYLNDEPITTLYFGGGTPSILPTVLLEKIINVVDRIYSLDRAEEITLEANPDDLSKEKLYELKSIGINRLSIGIQTFQPKILKFLNRVHNSKDAILSIENARHCGFNNINIDLIYGILEDGHSSLKEDIKTIGELIPTHISAYNLTIEPATVFGNWLKKGKLKETNEEYAAIQFDLVRNTLAQYGYEQYEVSNFARNKTYSKHNTNYWRNVPYLGVGPSAHSFDGISRQFNISNNAQYIRSLEVGKIPFHKEELDNKTRVNEMIMTGLRTKWGVSIIDIKSNFGFDLIQFHKSKIDRFLLEHLLEIKNDTIVLTSKGLLLADEITSELFLD